MYMYTLQGTNIRYQVPPNMKLGRNHGRKNAKLGGDTVDGRNPAPVDMQNRPLGTGYYKYQVLQNFSHQQCVSSLQGISLNMCRVFSINSI